MADRRQRQVGVPATEQGRATDRDDRRATALAVVPVPATAPRSESGALVYPTADWHEREAYDLVGIEYDDHLDLQRILLPETWQGHPLGPDYDDTEPQTVTFRKRQNPLTDDHRDGDLLFVNMGPTTL